MKAVVIFIFTLFCMGFGAAAQAQNAAFFESERLTAQLLTAERAVSPDAGQISAALDVTLEEDWHAYWRSPGEVGLPPEIDWSTSENVKSADTLFPAPRRFDAFGIENFGYKNRVTFPINITLSRPGRATELRASVFLLVCETLCVPEEFTLSLSLPASTTTSAIDQHSARLIAAAAESVPDPRAYTALSHLTDAKLVLDISGMTRLQSPDVFPESGSITLGKPDIRLSEGGTRLWASFDITGGTAAGPFNITVTDGTAAFETISQIAQTAPPPPYAQPAPLLDTRNGLLITMLIAFLGGIILNVMPCVLPVLSIKLAGALNAHSRSAAQVRLGFLISALGILTFMWCLGLAIIAAQYAGWNVGWGIQFQNAGFLAFMSAVILLFAANTLGAFEFSLPQWLMRNANDVSAKPGYVGDFASGLFAAVLATPCSAPFLGTAITFALTGTAFDIIIIFSMLGLGLSLPYLFVAMRPGILQLLPKPGAWMLWVKWLLGALLALTAVWLLTVLWAVGGAAVVIAVLGLTGPAVASLSHRSFSPNLGAAITVSALAAAVVLSVLLPASPPPKRADIIVWSTFDRSEIARSVARGEIVFVDITADWCLTCKANKRLVLDRTPIAEVLGSDAVIAMRGDWTRPNSTISRYLEANNRFGIPFNAVYGPSAPDGILLSEILTAAAVLDAIEAAR